MQPVAQRRAACTCRDKWRRANPVLGTWGWESCCRHSAELWKEPGNQSQTAFAFPYSHLHPTGPGRSFPQSVTGGGRKLSLQECREAEVSQCRLHGPGTASGLASQTRNITCLSKRGQSPALLPTPRAQPAPRSHFGGCNVLGRAHAWSCYRQFAHTRPPGCHKPHCTAFHQVYPFTV